MTIIEKAKQLGICHNRVHESHQKVWESRKDSHGHDPMFYRNEMALAVALERIKELEAQLAITKAVGLE